MPRPLWAEVAGKVLARASYVVPLALAIFRAVALWAWSQAKNAVESDLRDELQEARVQGEVMKALLAKSGIDGAAKIKQLDDKNRALTEDMGAMRERLRLSEEAREKQSVEIREQAFALENAIQKAEQALAAGENRGMLKRKQSRKRAAQWAATRRS